MLKIKIQRYNLKRKKKRNCIFGHVNDNVLTK